MLKTQYRAMAGNLEDLMHQDESADGGGSMATINIDELKAQYLELAEQCAEQKTTAETLQGKIRDIDDDLIRLRLDLESREHEVDEAFDLVAVKQARAGLTRLQAEIDAVEALRTNLDRQLRECRTAEITYTTKLGTIRRRIWQHRLAELLAEFGERNRDLLARIHVAGDRSNPGLIGFDIRKSLYEALALDRRPSPDVQARAASAMAESDLGF